MPNDLVIICSCGALKGHAHDLGVGETTHLVCYCDDCQAFAYFLERADAVLDAHGGTEVVQISPAKLSIEEGRDRLACVRLTPKGPLRWYTACCRTPIGATLATRHVPFIGLNHLCIEQGDVRGSLDGQVGPVEGAVFGRFARGDRSTINAPDGMPLSLMVSGLGKILKRRLRGDHRKTPFFDQGTGAPIAVANVLSDTERQALEDRRLAA